jgi:hypothetical protein
VRSVYLVVTLLGWCALTSVARPQDKSPAPDSRTKVCVAVVNNRTSNSIMEDRMTERLARGLSDSKLIGIVMDSVTTKDRELHSTIENSEEVKSLECDYLVLTQVSDPRSHPVDMSTPSISIGGKAPSTDVSDPMGGQSHTPTRDTLDVNFAVFRTGSPKALLNTKVSDQVSANVSDSLMQAVDREANRIGHDLKKK